MTANNTLCRCGSAKTYALCCQPFHEFKSYPETAEQLMRSRYTAFCLNNDSYLNETLYPEKRLTQQTITDKATNWIQLNILSTQQGTASDTIGSVVFIATFEENGEFFDLQENSNFIKKESHWFYVDGKTKVKNISLKWKRNEPCWCYSGLKYKKCHG
jgi:SEC-C motif-containing protein